jgi:trehalose synthase
MGGGVAVLLETLIPLFNEVGIKTQWKVIKGNKPFFDVTKNFHNAIQGQGDPLSATEQKLYLKMNKRFADSENINHDFVINHDPQPAASISFVEKKQPWIWRCHIDLSHPDMRIWSFLREYVSMHDTMIVSDKDFMRKDVKIPQRIIMPSINPLEEKNKPMSENSMKRVLSKYGIDQDKPILCQISRFDKWKDPIGVIEVFKKVNSYSECKLVLLGSAATDDPEGMEIFKKVAKYTKNEKNIIVINHEDNKLVNALQTKSAVVLQKSLKEGFGLTVSEALWKGTPVIGGKVGGIRSQIIDGKNGYLVDPLNYNQCAKKTIEILNNDKLREQMGKYGREHVKKNFLTTRHLLEWIMAIKSVMK